MKNTINRKTTRKLHMPAILAALLCFACMMSLITLYQFHCTKEEHLQIEYIARTVEAETYETLLTQMNKTRVLEAHLIETGGNFDSFQPIAEVLLKDKAVRSLLFAPDGIVSGAYPTTGNEPVLGLNMNSNGLGNCEARASIETGELILAGPFALVEGGMGICGRLPVYLKNELGQKVYWGLACITLNYPDIFAKNPIHHVNEQGFACQIWRINPDDNQKQVILETQIPISTHMSARQYPLTMFNATWTIELAPLTLWYQRPLLWILAFASIAISLISAFGIESRYKVRKIRSEESVRQINALQQQLEWEQTNTMLSQISTHFFYHTLNAIQALIVLKPDDAYKMAEDFSRYLRFNVDAITADGVVSFKEELRAVRAYAEINEAQLGDRLHVIFNIADVDFKIPALTIQPIVENAILHGIKPKVGGGTVTVSLTEDDDNWYITVSDDGVGFNVEQQQKAQSIGLTNVRKRISRFPNCSLEIASAPSVGTNVVLKYSKI